jgi:DNA replication initiation complex subunit (GINS family)
MDEPRREDYALDSLYFDDLRRYIDSLRAALGEEIERLKRWYESTISVRELALTDRAERAESALREAREKERERCAKFLDGRISGSPGSLQATLVDAEVIQCAKAIRSMTDEK